MYTSCKRCTNQNYPIRRPIDWNNSRMLFIYQLIYQVSRLLGEKILSRCIIDAWYFAYHTVETTLKRTITLIDTMILKPLIGVNKRFSESVSRKQIEFSVISSDNIVILTEYSYQERAIRLITRFHFLRIERPSYRRGCCSKKKISRR